jgi:STE24 endopeptidase
MFISLPVQNIISRSFEKQADEAAIKLTDDPQAQISLMKKIAVSNLSSVNPSLVIKYIIYSHPPIIERIESASNY